MTKKSLCLLLSLFLTLSAASGITALAEIDYGYEVTDEMIDDVAELSEDDIMNQLMAIDSAGHSVVNGDKKVVTTDEAYVNEVVNWFDEIAVDWRGSLVERYAIFAKGRILEGVGSETGNTDMLLESIETLERAKWLCENPPVDDDYPATRIIYRMYCMHQLAAAYDGLRAVSVAEADVSYAIAKEFAAAAKANAKLVTSKSSPEFTAEAEAVTEGYLSQMRNYYDSATDSIAVARGHAGTSIGIVNDQLAFYDAEEETFTDYWPNLSRDGSKGIAGELAVYEKALAAIKDPAPLE